MASFVGDREWLYASRKNQWKYVAVDPENYVRLRWNSTKFNNKEEKKMDKLYQYTLDGETVYGTILTYNSDGLAVFEDRATRSLTAVDESLLTRVMPHTIAVVFKPNGQKYHFKGKADIGDYIIREDFAGFSETFPICRVVAVDTKSESATKELKGFNLTKQCQL